MIFDRVLLNLSFLILALGEWRALDGCELPSGDSDLPNIQGHLRFVDPYGYDTRSRVKRPVVATEAPEIVEIDRPSYDKVIKHHLVTFVVVLFDM